MVKKSRGRPIDIKLDNRFRKEVSRFVRSNFGNKLQADDIIKLENRIISRYIPDRNKEGEYKSKPISKTLGIKRLEEKGVYERGFEKGYYHDKKRGGLHQERFLTAIFGKNVITSLENKTRLSTNEEKGYQDIDLANNIHRILRNSSAFYLASEIHERAIVAFNEDPDNLDKRQLVESLYDKWKNEQIEKQRGKLKI